ncbi:MAG TPA: hypothetical protein ENK18_23390 [Deltaproteobacteria bacterium]|nr:hypothetical protein [Deltaproteobacteria bacterium]
MYTLYVHEGSRREVVGGDESPSVMGWALAAKHMQTELLCLTALSRAVATRQPEPGTPHHSGRGSRHTSDDHHKALENAGLVPSMSRWGSCWGNAVVGSSFDTLEQELVLQQGLPADDPVVRQAGASSPAVPLASRTPPPGATPLRRAAPGRGPRSRWRRVARAAGSLDRPRLG